MFREFWKNATMEQQLQFFNAQKYLSNYLKKHSLIK